MMLAASAANGAVGSMKKTVQRTVQAGKVVSVRLQWTLPRRLT